MNLTQKILGLSLAAAVGFASASYADDSAKGSGKKSLESRIAELEAKLKDATGGGVKGSGIKISGYVDTSYTVNLSDRDSSGPIAGGAVGQNTGRVFDSQFDSFNLNAVVLTIQKDKDSSKFPAGFRVDTIYGEDARAIRGGTSAGGGLATANDSEFGVIQGYITLGVPVGNGIDVKFGKMVTLLGYEVVQSPANWQFSRSDAFRLSPVTQTGATFGYNWNDYVTTTVGVINGWDQAGGGAVFGASNRNLDPSFVGRLDVSAPKNSLGEFNAFVAALYGNDQVTPAVVAGAAPGVAGTPSTENGAGQYIWNIGGTWNKPFGVKPLGLGIDYLYRNDTVAASAAPLAGPTQYASIDANALSAYGKWDWNKWLTSSARFSYAEYRNAVQTNGGVFVGSESLSPLAIPTGGFQPTTTDLYSFTLTQAFNVWKDTLIRLEWRRDWTDTGSVGFGTAATANRDDIRQEQDTIAVNLVYSF